MYGFRYDYLQEMLSSRVNNYAGLPGLESALVAANSNTGTVRLFEASRHPREQIVPHSHRFDFQCLVIRGEVKNTVWTVDTTEGGDLFAMSVLNFKRMGDYDKQYARCEHFTSKSETYFAGAWYSMGFDDIHSIEFSRDALVLFFEGRSLTNTTTVLEPVVDGEVIPLLKVEPWMFKKEAS